MKKLYLFLFILILSGCSTITPPPDFTFVKIPTRTFTLASWQKITSSKGTYKIYIEGDGHAFNSRGFPTSDPTPHSDFMRKLAFSDNSPNVIYLARPCQFIKSDICSVRHWTTARFAPEVINAEFEAVKTIAQNNPIILIGFSGGAQVAGLISSAKSGLNVKKIVTIAGNLDHLAWTNFHQLPPLNQSMELSAYKSVFALIPQIHYVGTKDKVIPPELTYNFIQNDKLIIPIKDASHNSGWDSIFAPIHQLK